MMSNVHVPPVCTWVADEWAPRAARAFQVFHSRTTRCLVVHVLLGGRELALVPVEEAHTPAVAGHGSDGMISC
jgi:hypothetical protein